MAITLFRRRGRHATAGGAGSSGWKRGLSAFAAVSLVAGVGFSTGVAQAAPGDSTSSARFLSGSLLLGGVNLDSIVELAGAEASSPLNEGPNTSALDITALDTLNVSIPGGISLGALSSFLAVGAVNHYAEATPGSSRAATGAVSDSGAVDTTGGSDFPADAGVNLQGLLGDEFADAIADLDLQLGAISAVAATTAGGGAPTATCADLDAPVNCRDYTIANGSLTFESPLIADLVDVLQGPDGVVQTVDAAVAGLAGPSGALAQALAGLNPALGSLIGNSGLTVKITSDVAGAVDGLLNLELTDGVIRIDLRSGLVTVDLDALLTDELGPGVGLGSLAPNTQILSAPVMANLVARVGAVLNTLPAALDGVLTGALNAATLNIAANICLLGTGPGCLEDGVGTGIDVNVNGTLEKVLDGTAAADITLIVGGVPVAISVGTLLTALAAPINSALFSPAPVGVVSTVVLSTTAAVATIVTTLSPAITAINTVVSLIGNVQEPGSAAGSYREVALRLGLGTGVLATVDLARVEVGPNLAPLPVPTTSGIDPDSGLVTGGTVVTLTGTGFVVDATSVTIGGILVPAADVVVADDGLTLTFTTPAHEVGLVDVTATTAGGTSGPQEFTYLPLPVPTTSGIDPDSGPLAGGNTVTVTGSGFVTGTTVIFNGVPVIPTSISDDGTTLTVVVPPGTVAGPVTVTVTNTNGTSPGLTYTYLPPTLVVPAPGGPGQDIPVKGGGWPPNTPVTLTPTDTAGNPVGPPVTVTTDEDGNLPPATTVRVNPGTPAGNYLVTGFDGFGNRVTTDLIITKLPALPNTGAGPVIPLAMFGLGLLLIGGLFLAMDSNLRRRGRGLNIG